jgi:hypothetical protein
MKYLKKAEHWMTQRNPEAKTFFFLLLDYCDYSGF